MLQGSSYPITEPELSHNAYLVIQVCTAVEQALHNLKDHADRADIAHKETLIQMGLNALELTIAREEQELKLNVQMVHILIQQEHMFVNLVQVDHIV